MYVIIIPFYADLVNLRNLDTNHHSSIPPIYPCCFIPVLEVFSPYHLNQIVHFVSLLDIFSSISSHLISYDFTSSNSVRYLSFSTLSFFIYHPSSLRSHGSNLLVNPFYSYTLPYTILPSQDHRACEFPIDQTSILK